MCYQNKTNCMSLFCRRLLHPTINQNREANLESFHHILFTQKQKKKTQNPYLNSLVCLFMSLCISLSHTNTNQNQHQNQNQNQNQNQQKIDQSVGENILKIFQEYLKWLLLLLLFCCHFSFLTRSKPKPNPQ